MFQGFLTIQEIKPNVIAAHMGTKSKPEEATPLERAIAGLYDIAFKTVMQMILEKTTAGEMIEGKHVEEFVRAAVKRAMRDFE